MMLAASRYDPRPSPLQALDPRVKILAVIVGSLLILQADPMDLLLAGGLIMAAAWLGHVSLLNLLRTVRPVWVFFGVLFIFYLLFTPGTPLPGFPLGPVVLTREGAAIGLVQICRFWLLILVAAVLTMTTAPNLITMGLERLLSPLGILGISSHNIATMVELALRFLPLLEAELTTRREAQLARGADLEGGSIRSRIKAMIDLATPLALGVIGRCEAIINAMEARGFQPGSRTYLHELKLRRTDYALLLLLGAAAWLLLRG